MSEIEEKLSRFARQVESRSGQFVKDFILKSKTVFFFCYNP